MKIAIFTDAYFPHISGVVTVVDQQTRKLAEQGNKIKIFCPKFKKNQTETASPLKNIEIIRLPANLPFPGYSTLFISIPTVTKSLKQIKKFKPDIVHIHTEGGVGWEGLICAKIRKLPIITTLHTFLAHQEYLKNIKLGKLETFQKVGWKYTLMIHNQAQLVICPSKAMKDEALKHGLEVETKIIANGIDLEKYKKANKNIKKYRKSSSNFEFVFVGRIAIEKSLHILIKAFEIVHRQRPAAKLKIIGDGPALADLKTMVNNLKLAGTIIFTGAIPHDQLISSDLISSAYAFITPSKTENQPISVLEAMAFGLPIIGAEALGLPELIDHNQNGFLVKPDSPRQMAKFANQLIENPQLASKMGKKSLELIKNFSLTKTAEQLEKTYQKLSSN